MCIVVIAEIKIWGSIYAKSCNVCGKLGRSGQMGIKLREQSPDSKSDDAEYWVRFPLWVSLWIRIYIHAGIDISWFLLLHIQYKTPHSIMHFMCLSLSKCFFFPSYFFFFHFGPHIFWFIPNWLCLEECQFHAPGLFLWAHSWTLLVLHHYGSPITNNFLAFVAGLWQKP